MIAALAIALAGLLLAAEPQAAPAAPDRAASAADDEELLRHLELVEQLELLERFELLVPEGAEAKKAEPPAAKPAPPTGATSKAKPAPPEQPPGGSQ